MPQMANRVQETTTTGGTGTITLGGAITGYLTFASSFTTSSVLFYTIDNGVGEWEIGIGTLVTTGTLSRDTVIASSNGGALVNFGSGTKRVFCSAPTRSLVPDQDSKSGYVLTTDGTSPAWTQTLNSITIGNTTPAAGAFTTLSASSTVSGTGFSTYLASPPAIGGTAPAAGAFTTLSASSTVSGTGFSTYLASPPAIGGTTPAAGAFTTLSASSTVSGTGFSTYLASPPAIGGTAPAAGSFTNLSYTGTLTGSTGVLNIGSGQIYKNASGNVGIGTSSPLNLLHVSASSSGGVGGVITTANAALAAVGNESVIGFRSASQFGTTYYSGKIRSIVRNASTFVSDLAFNVYDASGPDGKEALRIDSSGNLLLRQSSNATNNSVSFNTTIQNALTLDASGNLGIGTTSFGTSAATVLSIATGTAPTTGPADTVQFYSSDRSAGNTIPSFFCEGSGVITANTTAAATHRIAMRINGTIYYFLANTAA